MGMFDHFIFLMMMMSFSGGHSHTKHAAGCYGQLLTGQLVAM